MVGEAKDCETAICQLQEETACRKEAQKKMLLNFSGNEINKLNGLIINPVSAHT